MIACRYEFVLPTEESGNLNTVSMHCGFLLQFCYL